MREEQVISFSFVEEKKHEQENTRKMYQFFVGIDIGASFHVASCIHFQAFFDPKGREWKRAKARKKKVKLNLLEKSLAQISNKKRKRLRYFTKKYYFFSHRPSKHFRC